MSWQRRFFLVLAVVGVSAVGYELGKYSSGRASQARPQIVTEVKTGAVVPSNHANRPEDKIAVPKVRARRNEPSAELPTGPFGPNVEIFKRLADNNADAAYMLAKGYQDCQFFVPPKDETAAAAQAESSTVMQLGIRDQLVDQAKDIATKNGQSLGTIPEVPVQALYQANLSDVQKRTQECTGVDTTAARDWMTWQRRAAELGNPDAELKFWQSLRQNADARSLEELMQDKRVAEAALQDSLSHGDVRASIAIGETRDVGLFSDPDPFSAYAYFFAASQAPTSDTSDLPWIGQNLFQLLAFGTDTQQYLQRALDRVGSRLNPAQQQAARELGLSLYQQCCQAGGT